ncbi:MAG: SH3 domain-containing protein [Patescibacteria group bacterium]
MIHQNSKVAPILMFCIVGAVFAFSLYVLLTTENTVVVINEAAAEPKEVFVVENSQPEPESEGTVSPAGEPAPNPRLQILETSVGFLNVRSDATLEAQKVGTVKPGEVYEYTETKNTWYRIVHPELQNAWVSGEYVKVVDRSSDLFGE